MPKLDLTITISVIIAICAIISPIITTWINNAYAIKMKKLEYSHQEKEQAANFRRNVYEQYLRLTSQCIMDHKFDNIGAYGNIYPMALIYFPEELIPSVIELHSLISDDKYNIAREKFNLLAPKIRNQLKIM